MNIGFHLQSVPTKVGGGYVLRDDIVRAAMQFKGRHQFHFLRVPTPVRATSWLYRKAGGGFGAPSPTARWVAREARRNRLDLLWFNHFSPIYAGVPYVLNIFDLQHRVQPFFPEVSANGEWEYRERALSKGCQKAAFVTVGSEEVKSQVSFFYGVLADNIHVLPFPTPQKAIDIATGKLAVAETAKIREKYGLRNDFLFYPAQFWAHKNHVNLLHALKLLRDGGRNISLVLTGSDHGNRSHVETVCRELGLQNLVHFCGFVPYEDILAFYRQARALSYLSFQGPENLPPLEAMALGCPVILSDIPGARALHGDVPFWVDPRDPRSIAEKIAFVLDHPGEVAAHTSLGQGPAIQNDCEKYLESLQLLFDKFEFYRRCWG